MLQLSRVEKFYYDKLIISLRDFSFQQGTTWISGTNGSGKTTLLKIMAGMIPFNGDVTLQNISLKKQAVSYRRHISYAEAEPLYPSFVTGNNLVMYFQGIRKASQKEIDELIAFSGLRSVLNNPVGIYSSGMMKRLSLLLAFIGHVSVILLDEPLATLDAEAVEALPGLIENFSNRYGTSFILSSHQQLPDSLQIDKHYKIDGNTIQ